jgi:hypothetical protein
VSGAPAGAAAEVLRRDLGIHHTPLARPLLLCFGWSRGANRPAPVTGHPVPLPSGAPFRRDRARGPVDCGSDASSELSIAVEEFNDAPRGGPAERVSRTTRNSVSASIVICALPHGNRCKPRHRTPMPGSHARAPAGPRYRGSDGRHALVGHRREVLDGPNVTLV